MMHVLTFKSKYNCSSLFGGIQGFVSKKTTHFLSLIGVAGVCVGGGGVGEERHVA